ncbi:uncharacterized protein LOC122363781 [Amphibalanus amphitrite]|uniref:uncharacterized protein LOC122363781 n=1 Tax=Amphibalanus amphitrite TaxID=1232801 RepID=UPI001C919925|nr:uncharacterized protein LOC122363781 [Amphibalanus amphitrite]
MKCSGVILCAVVLVALLAAVNGVGQRRCFQCRSRGSRGGCKDSFSHNMTQLLAGGVRGVRAEPCASGWCGKIIEGDTGVNDYDTATERMCMQRPPSDLQERCDLTMYGQYRKVYLCMCQGDLCNGAGRTPASAAAVTAAALLSLTAAALLS